MENNQLNSPDFLHKRKGEDKNFKAFIDYQETVYRSERIEPERIVILARLIWIKDETGRVRETEQGTEYKVYIENGEIHFNKPLKFKNNG